MKVYKLSLTLTLLILALVSFTSCNTTVTETKSTTPRKVSFSSIKSPLNNAVFTIGDSINFNIINKENIEIDSTHVKIQGVSLVKSTSSIFSLPTNELKTGLNSFKVTVYLNNQTVERKVVNATLLSDITPKPLSYSIKKQHPHNPESYTQGLFMNKNDLYETTGRKGKSNLIKIDLTTGKSINQVSLENKYFGEGSSVIGDSIFVLTWQSRTGFIYDKNTFAPVGQFQYQTEGWGLATINKDTLIMSDGTNKLYYMSPAGFTNLGSIEVYDHLGPVDELNELEYVNGKLYANRYLTNYIYVIDPRNGKVEATLDLTNIYDWSTYPNSIDVLNGIAYNEKNNTFYVTGKWWPFLFEVDIF